METASTKGDGNAPETRGPAGAPRATFAQLYTPKLITVLREGYDLAALRADIVAGLTVAIVALPLSMAIAIASGATPDRGLYTAIIGGFLISLLGGSRFQIGGPAGAFIVLVAATIDAHGIDGMLLATLMAGGFLILMGLFRLGTYIKFIPYPVTVGFTAGIAVIILASQLRDLFGLTLPGKEPGELLPKLEMLWTALPTANWAAVAIAALTIVIIALLRRYQPQWPGMLIAVIVAAGATALLNLPVETIGTRFGGIPGSLPAPAIPAFSLEKAQAVLPSALAFALLGAIESLLSAVVADGMTGRRHRSNLELVAQGIANIGSAIFGGIPATGTIARTATNVRAGARGPISGMLHAAFLLVFMLLLAPLASYIPLAALAGVLAVVAWIMAERHAFVRLITSSRGDAVVLLATFLLTIIRDLSTGIVVGFAIAALIFIHRMAQSAGVEPASIEDRADDANGARTPYDSGLATDPDVLVYRITGAFFFGAASSLDLIRERVTGQYKAFVVDVAGVPFLDSSGANALVGLATAAARHGTLLYVTGATPALRKVLIANGLDYGKATYQSSIAEAVAAFKAQKGTAA
jgi:SulP family sulfate permease